MFNLNYFCVLLTILNTLTLIVWSGPVPLDPNCQGDDVYDYDSNKEYEYSYYSNSLLWINDVSKEAESNLYLNLTVGLQRVEPCRYQMKLRNVDIFGDGITNSDNLASELEKNVVVFSIGSNGAVNPLVKFNGFEQKWSRNIKRGIISAFQTRSESVLKYRDPLDTNANEKSSVVYETDLFGKCRTIYKSRKENDGVKIVKKKALHRCSLDIYADNPFQGDTYKSVSEYYNGHTFIEHYKCESNVKNGVLTSTECKQESTVKAGSRGDNGIQGVAKVKLTFVKTNPASAIAPLDRTAPSSIVHDYADEAVSQSNFDVAGFINNVCKKTEKGILDDDHAQQFRELLNFLKPKSKSELISLFNDATSKCKFAGNALVSGVVFTDTDSSVEAVLDLLDKDVFKDAVLVTEFPLLTAAARNRHPSADLINKFKSYLAGKDSKFVYLQKSYLIYSALVKTFCAQNDCSSNLDDWTSILVANLGSDCADSSNKEAVVGSLKAIGNIGHIKDISILENCAAQKENILEVRVSAIQAFRRFSCRRIENLDGNYKLLQDSSDDAEVRINAFRILTRCLNSEKFQNFASKAYSDFLIREEDYQVVSYIIDFAKEHGATVLLNPILSHPEIREKLQLNFKEFSWNNYKFKYSVVKDSALEVDASVIYTSKTFVPRSVNLNITLHGFGISINALEATIRLEGLDEALKAVLVDRLASEQLLRRLTEKPEQLLDILKSLADKLKYSTERPYASLSLRIYGSEVFFSQLDTPQKIQLIGGILSNWKSLLYKERQVFKNVQLFNSVMKKPLLNGFEFGADADINFGILHVRKGNRQFKGGKTDFSLKLQNGASLYIRRHFTLKANEENKLQLRKDVEGKFRLNLDFDGYRQDSAVQYNLNIVPEEEIRLFKLEGKFYKLAEGSNYQEIKNFVGKRKVKSFCTSENFHNNVGLDLCYAIERPKLRSLKEVLSSLHNRENDMDVEEDSDDFDFDTSDDDNDDDDDDDDDFDYDRPMVSLAGPYRYEVAIKNSDLINKFVITGKTVKSENSKSFEGSLQSTSQKNVQRRLDLVYSRYRNYTSRTYNRGFSLELRVPQNDDVRFHFSSILDYRNKELIDYRLRLDNKILNEFSYNLHFNRKQKVEGQSISNYTLESTYNSKILSPDGINVHFIWTLFGIEKSVKLEASLELDQQKLFFSNLDLIHKNGPHDNNYDFYFVISDGNEDATKVEVTSDVGFGLLSSDISADCKYTSDGSNTKTWLGFRVGHAYNSGGEGHVLVDLNIPLIFFGGAHGFKITFEFNELKKHLELELNSPQTRLFDTPKKLYFTLTKNQDESEKHFSLGFKHLDIDLSESHSKLAEFIKKTSDNELFKDFSIEISVEKNLEKHSKDITFEIDANGITVSSVHIFYFGNLAAIRANPDEIAEQELGAGLNFKISEFKGGLKGNVRLANSKSKKTRNYNVNIQATDLLKSVFRLNEADVTSDYQNGKIKFKASILKEADQYKSIDVTANGQVRGDSNAEFDFDYVKKFNDGGTKTGKGVAKYTMTDSRNFNAHLSVQNLFKVTATLVNERKEGHVLHRAILDLTHLDNQNPVEKKFEFEFHKHVEKTESITLKIEARNGKPGQLANDDQLNYIVGIYGELIKAQLQTGGKKKVVALSNRLRYKSVQRNFDIDHQLEYADDIAKGVNRFNKKSNAKFPSLLSGEKALRFLNSNLAIEFGLDKTTAIVSYTFETDSQFFGRLFRFMKFNYKHEVNKNKLFNLSVSADYKLPPNEDNPSPEQKAFKLDFDIAKCEVLNQKLCFDVNLGVKQEISETCSNFQLKGDYLRTGGENDTNIKTGVNIKCDQALVTNTKLEYAISLDNGVYLRRDIKLESNSHLYTVKRFELGFVPFNKHRGLSRLALYYDEECNFDKTIEYTREVDVATNKMKSFTYKAILIHETGFKKLCELTIDKKKNYLNRLNCELKVPSVSTPVSYGYRIFIANPTEMFFGQRNIELSVSLPTGRELKVEYKGHKATPIDNTDDDNDPNDEREFNGTASIYWDYANDRNKVVFINLKRDNVGPGHFNFFIEAVNTPLIKTVRLDFIDKRLFNETNLNLGISYELKNGKKNRLDITGRTSSDFNENSFVLEINLERPKFNVLYANDFNKQTGRLKQLRLRVAELLNFVVDKEFDPNNRRLSLEFYNRAGGSNYKVEATSSLENDIYTVQGTLKQGTKSLSTIKSVYDSLNTNLNVKVDALVTKKQYDFNTGLIDESNAVCVIKQDGKIVGVAGVGLTPVLMAGNIRLHDLVVNIKWNRFWHQFQENVLGGVDSPSAAPSENLPAGYVFNSYLGDIYAELLSDLKPIADSIRENKAAIKQDLFKSALLQLEFYGSVIKQAEAKKKELEAAMQPKIAEPVLPLHVRLFNKYNSLSDRLDGCFEKVYNSKFRFLAKYIPRLSRISYNSDNNSEFDNNITIKKRTLRAGNLYQFNAEYRERVRRIGNLILRFKSYLVRDVKGISIRALFNKYKYRSIRFDYTLVGSVFNRRNIIGFGGESESLHTKARYLLAHDTQKNKFSVILNYDDHQQYALTVYFYGKGPIGINSDKASYNNKPIALPKEINLENGKSIYIGKIHNGICVHVDHEVKVCCYENSNSCTVALTRWWTGKVNGLFGKTTNFPQKLKQEDWVIDKVDFRKAQLKPSSEDAVRKCYYLFGKHRRSPFRNALMAVRPNGWRKICESALTFDQQKNYCPLIRAFAEHTQLEYVHVDVPAECYRCKNNEAQKSYMIGEKFGSNENDEDDVVTGADVVFLSLPCDSKKFGFNYEGLLQQFNKDNSQSNNYYAIKIDKDETSIYQAENGNFVNFDLKAAAPVLQRDSNGLVHEEAFDEALFYAQTLFARRVASARYLVIISCGNCVPYNSRKVKKLAKQLAARNIIVSAWGDYNMNLGEDAESDIAVGYNEDDLYLYTKGSNELNSDSFSNYKVQHEADTCHSLAVRTHGSVFNVKEFKKLHILNNIPKWFKSSRNKHTFKLQACEVVHNKYFGDFGDFKFSRIQHEENNADEEGDHNQSEHDDDNNNNK